MCACVCACVPRYMSVWLGARVGHVHMCVCPGVCVDGCVHGLCVHVCMCAQVYECVDGCTCGMYAWGVCTCVCVCPGVQCVDRYTCGMCAWSVCTCVCVRTRCMSVDGCVHGVCARVCAQVYECVDGCVCGMCAWGVCTCVTRCMSVYMCTCVRHASTFVSVHVSCVHRGYCLHGCLFQMRQHDLLRLTVPRVWGRDFLSLSAGVMSLTPYKEHVFLFFSSVWLGICCDPPQGSLTPRSPLPAFPCVFRRG